MSNSEIVIALDAMGGDGAPDVVIHGANIARVRYPQLRFMFFGKQESVAAGLESFRKLKQVSTVHHADEVVADNDKPVEALRKRHGSSMRLAIDAVGEEGGARRRLGRQHRRAHGAGEGRAQDPAGDRPPGDGLDRADDAGARASCSTSAPTSTATR